MSFRALLPASNKGAMRSKAVPTTTTEQIGEIQCPAPSDAQAVQGPKVAEHRLPPERRMQLQRGEWQGWVLLLGTEHEKGRWEVHRAQVAQTPLFLGS